jgi:hypothetical protein
MNTTRIGAKGEPKCYESVYFLPVTKIVTGNHMIATNLFPWLQIMCHFHLFGISTLLSI